MSENMVYEVVIHTKPTITDPCYLQPVLIKLEDKILMMANSKALEAAIKPLYIYLEKLGLETGHGQAKTVKQIICEWLRLTCRKCSW